jgi:dTMP kinase
LEREDIRFHEKVREGYLRIARREQKRIIVIDASRPLEDVLKAVFENLEKLFSVKLAR